MSKAAFALFAALTLPAALAVSATAATKKVETERITAPTRTVDPTQPGAGERIVHKGEEGLPPLVAKTRRAILDAAYSGDLSRLRVVLQQSETPVSLSVNEVGDPIEYLKSQSGDGEGLEILAILTDILEAGWVRTDPNTPRETYVWPSFAARKIDNLAPDELVELYKIVTSADYDEMKTAGKYIFYGVGIGADGTWHYFKTMD